MRLITNIILVILLAAGIYGAFQYSKQYFHVEVTSPVETTVERGSREVPSQNALLVQQAESGKRLVNCITKCQVQAAPHSSDSEAVFGGDSWYYYQVNNKLTSLVRSWAQSNELKTIATETDLIKPRGLYMSPTGNRVVYFVDNIHEPNKHLTELWSYDATSEAVSIAVENLHSPDIITRPRWNAAGTLVWFVANSGTDKAPKVELITAPMNPAGAKASFTSLNWQQLSDVADKSAMDISADGALVAYSKSTVTSVDRLVITKASGQQVAVNGNGSIPFIQWLSDNSLIYAVQDNISFTFWQIKDDKASKVAQHTGVLRSARADTSGEYISFVADASLGKTKLFVLELKSGLIKEQTDIPPFGNQVFVVKTNQAENTAAPTVAGITTKLSDEQLAGFIDQHITEIVNNKDVKKVRFVITQEPNVVYLDYQNPKEEVARILLTIRDAINPEWTIRARYVIRGGEWEKTQGGIGTDPKPAKLFEWEDSVNQWILKTTY